MDKSVTKKHGDKGHAGEYAKKMNRHAPPGFTWRDGAYHPIDQKPPQAAAAAPPPAKKENTQQSAAPGAKMKILRNDTAAEEFEKDRENTNFDNTIEPPPKKQAPPAEPSNEAQPAAGNPPNPGNEQKPPGDGAAPPGKDEETSFFDQEFPFTFDDDDVERILEMFPLFTIPISELVARIFGRTINIDSIGMPEWKKSILRPGVKFYGEKILRSVCNPKFFFLAIIGFIIWDAIFNSVPKPTDPEESKESSEQHTYRQAG